MKNLASQLKQARINKGYSQNEVATLLNVTRQSISKWENDRGYPDLKNLKILSNLYGLSIDDLLQDDDRLKDRIDKMDHEQHLYANRDEGLFLMVLTLVSGIIPPVGIFIPMYVMWRNNKFNALYKTIYLVSVLTILISIIGTYIYVSDNWLSPSTTKVYRVN